MTPLRRFILISLALSCVGSLVWAQQRGWGRGRRSVPDIADRRGVPDWEVDPHFKHDVFTFVRIRYSSFARGGWTTDYPDADLNLSAWLHRIASNACMDVLRRRKLIRWLPWETFDTNPAMEPTADDDPVGEYNQAETSSEVQVVLNKLTPKHRMALVLKEYQGMSCDEIGEVMGASRSAVKSLLFRAREEFRQAYLAKYGQTPYADDRG